MVFNFLKGQILTPSWWRSFPSTRNFNGWFPTANRSSGSLRFRFHSSLSTNGTSLFVPQLAKSFPYVWLRDSCKCDDCVHPSTRQKLRLTSDVPLNTRPTPDGIKIADTGIHVEWMTGHQSYYPISFLERHSSSENLTTFHKDVARELWDARRISQTRDLFLPYPTLGTPAGLLSAITQLERFGILFISSVPNGETADETCELRTLAGRFGEIRRTFYGETWDVKNVHNSRNIAYTNLFLGLHMDLLYFEHPPRYQILHCLRNRVHGGTSIFVDAIHAVSALRASHPDDFAVLASTPIPFHYINDGHHLHREHPTIELARPHPSSSPENLPVIQHINYSPPFQAPLPLDTPPALYTALARFASLLDEPARRFEYTLREGDAVLFDNRRVLHARTAFSEREGETLGEGETNRWLKGCYLEADPVLDRGRVLRKKAEDRML